MNVKIRYLSKLRKVARNIRYFKTSHLCILFIYMAILKYEFKLFYNRVDVEFIGMIKVYF